MGVRERLGAAWMALRGESAPQPPGRKSKVFSFPPWMRTKAKWTIDNYRAYGEEGYNINSLIYAPVRYKARAIASVPLLAARGDMDAPEWLPDDHPLSRLVRRPNRRQTWRAFNEQRKTYLELAGNAYTYAERARGSGEVTALYNLRPDRMRILPSENDVQGYYYMPPGREMTDGVPMLPEDVSHVKYPHPLDDLEGLGYGLPPLMAAARDADTDNAVTTFIKVLFERGAMPVGMLRFETELTEAAAEDAKRRFMEKNGGVENWVEPIVMDQGGGYERIGMTFDELGFDVLDARNEARILSVWGVPPILLGTRYGIAHGTYSNYEEARKQFWQDVLVPELRMLEDEDQRLLQWQDGSYVLYDLSVVPALQTDMLPLVEAAERLMGMGVPANIAFAAVGLKIENVPYGDRPYRSTALVPVEDDFADPEPDATPGDQGLPELDAPDDPKAQPTGAKAAPGRWGPEQKALIWKALDDLAQSHEERFRAFAAAQFEQDRRDVLAVISEAREKALRLKATINWAATLPDAEAAIRAAGDRWQEAFVPIVRGVVEDVAGYWLAEAGLAFSVTRLEDQAFFTTFTADFWKQISLTSRQEITGVIQRGMREGWSIAQMQSGLEAVFDQWIAGNGNPEDQRFASGRLQPWRTEMIARTESTRSVSAAAQLVYREAGVKQREWISATDDRTRPDHLTANGQVRNIDEPFLVGGYRMMQPGDSSLGAPVDQIVFCRCSILPIIPDDL